MINRYILTLSDIVIGIVEILLIIRVLLKFLGASTQAPFVRWIYETTSPLLSPFEGMFPSSSLTTHFVLEVSTLFALITFALIEVVIETIIHQLTLISRK